MCLTDLPTQFKNVRVPGWQIILRLTRHLDGREPVSWNAHGGQGFPGPHTMQETWAVCDHSCVNYGYQELQEGRTWFSGVLPIVLASRESLVRRKNLDGIPKAGSRSRCLRSMYGFLKLRNKVPSAEWLRQQKLTLTVWRSEARDQGVCRLVPYEALWPFFPLSVSYFSCLAAECPT